MQFVSGVIVLVFLSFGACEIPSNVTEGACEVVGTTAECGEVFTYPTDARITRLIIRSSLLKNIEKNDFTIYENLMELDASNCALEHIDPDAFKSNQKLQDLNLSGNKDIHIPRNASFISSKSLTHLNLSHIGIEELSEQFFTDLPNLEVLDLTSTEIKNLSALSSLHLHTLIISNNSNINKTSICQQTTLQQIIEIENNESSIFNCSEKTIEDKVTTEVQPTTNTTSSTTEIPEPSENTTENIDTTTLVEISIPETSSVTTLLNSTSTEKQVEESKNITEPPEEVIKPETETETPKIVQETDGNKTEVSSMEDLDSLIQFGNISSPKTTVDLQPKDNKTHDDITDAEDVNNKAKPVKPQPTPQESSGTNIVLGIILCVMIVGAVGFGYKYWKNRRSGYRNANTEDVEEGKEMQNMVSLRAANGEAEQAEERN